MALKHLSIIFIRRKCILLYILEERVENREQRTETKYE